MTTSNTEMYYLDYMYKTCRYQTVMKTQRANRPFTITNIYQSIQKVLPFVPRPSQVCNALIFLSIYTAKMYSVAAQHYTSNIYTVNPRLSLVTLFHNFLIIRLSVLFSRYAFMLSFNVLCAATVWHNDK